MGSTSQDISADVSCAERHFQPARAWSAVAILLVFSLLSILDRQIVSLQVDPIRKSLGLSDTELGLLQGFAFALLYALGGIPLGWAVDRYSRRKLIYLGITFWSISAAATGLARSFWQMFAARTCVGVGEAVLGPAALSLISDLFPKNRVATPLGVYSAGFYLGSGAALMIGAYVVGVFSQSSAVEWPIVGQIASWQAVFIVTGLPGVGIAVLAFALPDKRASRQPAMQAPGEIRVAFLPFVRANFTHLLISFWSFGLVSFIAYAISAWAPSYYIRVHGLTPMAIGASYGAIIALAAPGAILGGMLTDRVFQRGHEGANYAVAGVASIASGPFLISAFMVHDTSWSMLSLATGMLLFGFTAPGPYSTFSRLCPAELRGRLMSCFVLFNALIGAGLAPVTVGFLTDNIFRSDQAVGQSLVLVIACTLPIIVALLNYGWRLRRN